MRGSTCKLSASSRRQPARAPCMPCVSVPHQALWPPWSSVCSCSLGRPHRSRWPRLPLAQEVLSPWPHTPPCTRRPQGVAWGLWEQGKQHNSTGATAVAVRAEGLPLISTPLPPLSAPVRWHQVHSLHPLVRLGFFLESELSFKL